MKRKRTPARYAAFLIATLAFAIVVYAPLKESFFNCRPGAFDGNGTDRIGNIGFLPGFVDPGADPLSYYWLFGNTADVFFTGRKLCRSDKTGIWQ